MKVQNTFTYWALAATLCGAAVFFFMGRQSDGIAFVFGMLVFALSDKKIRGQIFRETKAGANEISDKVKNQLEKLYKPEIKEPQAEADFNIHKSGTNSGRLYDHTDTQYFRCHAGSWL